MENKEYNKRILKKLQQTELQILKDFDSFCKKHNLPYFATGGTAIGALRHQGFIPWDDDIDVCMLRKDYEKFMELAPKELGGTYSFLCPEKNPEYPLMFGKMVKRGTKFVEAANAAADYSLGIFIDIFPYDKTSKNPKIRKKLRKKTWFWGRVRVLSLTSKPVLPDSMGKGLKLIASAGCKVIYMMMKIFRITPGLAVKNYRKWANQYYDGKKEGIYIDYSYLNSENLMVEYKDMFPLASIAFEDTKVNLVREYDKFLRPDYGDYMKLPPVEQRHNHYAAYIDFGDEIFDNRKER